MNKTNLTPTKSVKLHCYIFCMNQQIGTPSNCQDMECVLKNKKISALKRIKAFCAECAPDFKPKYCKGIILNTKETRDYGKCSLWVYRFGKNPKLRGLTKGRSPDEMEKMRRKKIL